MKRFRFLLLDAGPIIELFELSIWDKFISQCDVTICRTVADEAKWASQECRDIHIDLESYEREGRIHLVDVDLGFVSSFGDKFDPQYRASIHDGEKETLAFLHSTSEPWLVCAADGAVFRTLGLLGKSEQGVSLEEVLDQIGLGRSLKWQYTKAFRMKFTRLGQEDAIQERGTQ